MKLKIKSSANRIEHISNLLNQSTTKIAYSFQQSDRFNLNKSFSPDKYYDIASSFTRRSCSFGVSKKVSFEKIDYTEPARYNIPSSFQKKKYPDSGRKLATSFGISRQEYYKSKQKKEALAPTAYNIRDTIGSKHFYMGRRLQQPKDKNNLSCFTYHVKNEAYNQLSTYRKNEGNIKMKTQYYPKNNIQIYDNGVPGPGSYSYRKNVSNNNVGSYGSQRKKANSSFGIGQKVKHNKSSNLGPGSYKIFSQFGNNLQRQKHTYFDTL